MYLEEIRERVVRESGRYDLVGRTGGNPDYAVDAGVDAFINDGVRLVCDECPHLMSRYTTEVTLKAGEVYAWAQKLRTLNSIWFFDDSGNRRELALYDDFPSLQAAVGVDLSAVAQGTPSACAIAPISGEDLGPGLLADPDITDESVWTFDDADLVFANSRLTTTRKTTNDRVFYSDAVASVNPVLLDSASYSGKLVIFEMRVGILEGSIDIEIIDMGKQEITQTFSAPACGLVPVPIRFMFPLTTWRGQTDQPKFKEGTRGYIDYFDVYIPEYYQDAAKIAVTSPPSQDTTLFVDGVYYPETLSSVTPANAITLQHTKELMLAIRYAIAVAMGHDGQAAHFGTEFKRQSLSRHKDRVRQYINGRTLKVQG